jgi:hypothetical protein
MEVVSRRGGVGDMGGLYRLLFLPPEEEKILHSTQSAAQDFAPILTLSNVEK